MRQVDWVRWSVLTTWLGGATHLLIQVHRYAVDLPYLDDFAFVDRISGDSPVSLEWLWEPHNEHRIVIPKLLIVLLTRLHRIDFRVVPHFSAFILAAVALAAVLELARRRGKTVLADAMIPLALCSWAQSESVVWTTTVQFVGATGLLVAWWCFASRAWRQRSTWALLAAGGCALGVPLMGGNGVATLVGLLPWFIWFATRADVSRGARTLAVSVAIALCIYGAVYALAHEQVQGHPAPAGLVLGARYGVRLIAASITMMPEMAAVVGSALLALLGFAIWGAWGKRSDCPSAATDVALALSVVGVAAAVAIGRAGFGLTVVPRYVTLIAPLVLAHVALLDVLPLWRREIAVALATVALVSFSHGDKLGHSTARGMKTRLAAARAALVAGVADEAVVSEYEIFPGVEYAAPRLAMLRRVGGSVFRDTR